MADQSNDRAAKRRFRPERARRHLVRLLQQMSDGFLEGFITEQLRRAVARAEKASSSDLFPDWPRGFRIGRWEIRPHPAGGLEIRSTIVGSDRIPFSINDDAEVLYLNKDPISWREFRARAETPETLPRLRSKTRS